MCRFRTLCESSASAPAAYIFSERSMPVVNRTLQVIMTIVAFVSSIVPADLIWGIGDIGYGSLG